MTDSFKRIDLERYPRREHFLYFRDFAYPYVGMTCEVDITRFLARTRARAHPFFLTFLWHAAQAANAVPELRQRIADGGIVEFSRCPTSHTVAKADGTYAYCALDCDMPLDAFLPYASERQDVIRARGGIAEDAADALPLLFVSTAPWVAYTALVQPVPSPADSNPRITWGKYRVEGDRTMLPVSILCHHALADGLHIAAFYENLERALNGTGSDL